MLLTVAAILCGCRNDVDDFVHAVHSSDVCTSLSGDDEISAMIPLSGNEQKKAVPIRTDKKK